MKGIVEGQWVTVSKGDWSEINNLTGIIVKTNDYDRIVKIQITSPENYFGRLLTLPYGHIKLLKAELTELDIKNMIDVALDIKDYNMFKHYVSKLPKLETIGTLQDGTKLTIKRAQ